MSRAAKKEKLHWVGNPAMPQMYQPRTLPDGSIKPAPMVRDPNPKRGLLEFQDITQIGDPATSFREMCNAYGEDPANWGERYSWIELFLVVQGRTLYFFRPECMFTGFSTGEALASVPIVSINNANVQPKLDLLELHTESGKVYRFRSQQKGDVARWAFAIMHGTMSGMENFEDEGPLSGDIWETLNQQESNAGGLDSAISKPADKLEEAENQVLHELFTTILQCNGPKKMADPNNDKKQIDADFIDAADLMKWCSNRFNLVRDRTKREQLEQIVNFETIDAAINGCMVHDTEPIGRLDYDVFRRGMCDYTSDIRRVVLAMLNTFADLERWQYLEKVSGELNTTDYILMYHNHLGQVVKACRKQLNQEDEHAPFITNKEKVVRAHLKGVESEVEGLLKKFAEYHKRLHGLQPSLRERNQCAIDDTFDATLLPGEAWCSHQPRKSWAK